MLVILVVVEVHSCVSSRRVALLFRQAGVMHCLFHTLHCHSHHTGASQPLCYPSPGGVSPVTRGRVPRSLGGVSPGQLGACPQTGPFCVDAPPAAAAYFSRAAKASNLQAQICNHVLHSNVFF